MARMRLQVGKKYNVKLKWGIYEGVYYTGESDSLCWQKCDCCDKELMNGHLFMMPYKEATYEECIDGKFTDQVTLGTTCIKKVEITECQPE